MGVTRVLVLTWADGLMACLNWMIVIYLTDVWELNFTHAAGIVNIWFGLSIILVLVMTFLVHTFLAEFVILLLSSIAFSIGLGFLAMSTPPVKGNCDEYRPECLTDEQKTLFYAALALISVGISGHQASLLRFLLRQSPNMSNRIDDDFRFMNLFTSWKHGVALHVPIGGFIALLFIKQWSIRFGMPAIVSVFATLLFLTGSFSYKHHHRLEQSNANTNANANANLNTNTNSSRWRRCKATFRMIPIWAICLLYGIVSSLGKSFFLIQANTMNVATEVEKTSFPFLSFMIISGSVAQFFAFAYVVKLPDSFFTLERRRNIRRSRLRYSTIGIGISLIFAVLCCIAAAKVESQRLLKEEKKVNFSMYRLTPQYMLLGVANGVFPLSISLFVIQISPSSMRHFLALVSHGMMGLGAICSVVTVFGAEKLNWIRESLNTSRLDNYYWSLATLGAAVFVVYVMVAICYHKFSSFVDVDDDDDKEDVAFLKQVVYFQMVCPVGLMMSTFEY